MDGLPFELIEHISSFLDHESLKQTLLLSRNFQYAAEKHSLAFESYIFNPGDATHDTCSNFLKIYSDRRFRYLRYVEVHSRFPCLRAKEERNEVGNGPYDNVPEDIPCREGRHELREKDEIFTEQIGRVFATMKAAEDAAKPAHGPGKVQLVIMTPVRWVDMCYCSHRVYSAWRVHLLNPSKLPTLESVRGLSVCDPDVCSLVAPFWVGGGTAATPPYCAKSQLDWRIIIDLATKLPNLEYLGCELGTEETRCSGQDAALAHFERDWEACRRDSRHAFAKALKDTVMPKLLRHVQLDFLRNIYCVHEQRGGGPNISGPAPFEFDLFSSSLRALASNLRRLELRVIADQTLFWPPDGVKDTPNWPNLENIHIMFHISTPSGSWYFRGRRGEGADDTGYAVTPSMYPPLSDGENVEDERFHYETVFSRSSGPGTQVPHHPK